MIDKISLTDKQCENLAKGIAIGVGVGVLTGVIIGDVTLAFAAGGVLGIIGSLIYSAYEKHKVQISKKIKID